MGLFFILFILGSIINFVILFVMKFVPMKKKKSRKRIVMIYKIFYFSDLAIWFIGLVMMELWFVKFTYGLSRSLIYYFFSNEKLAAYVALTIAISLSAPLFSLLMKVIRKEEYKKQIQGRGAFRDLDENIDMQSLYYDMLNTKKAWFQKMPYIGVIHIVNAVLVIWINISKCFEVETSITSTSLYMAIVTFYAIDKITSYFLKKYSEFWRFVDNKFFLTKEIDNEVRFEFKDLMKMLDELYSNYIETGQYIMPEHIISQYFQIQENKNYIRVLTLNIDGGKELIDNSLSDYIEEIDADFVIFQEVKRRNIISKQMDFPEYVRFFPTKYQDTTVDIAKMNGNCGYTLLYAKKSIPNLKRDDSKDSGENRNRCYVKVENGDISILGIHLLLDNQQKLISNIDDCKCDIIAGDFNASIKRKDGENWKLLTKLSQKQYDDLWRIGVHNNQAYYIEYNGQKRRAHNEEHKTFVANTHIDYILGRRESIELEEIFIDMRTLAFTDHCAIIADLKKIV